MNRTEHTGWLTGDPKPLTETDNGSVYTTFRLRVPRRGSKKKSDFFTVVVWGAQAKACVEHLTEGRRVAVPGRLQQREWHDDNNVWRERVVIVADEVEFLGFPPDAQPAADDEKPSTPADDDIPF